MAFIARTILSTHKCIIGNTGSVPSERYPALELGDRYPGPSSDPPVGIEPERYHYSFYEPKTAEIGEININEQRTQKLRLHRPLRMEIALVSPLRLGRLTGRADTESVRTLQINSSQFISPWVEYSAQYGWFLHFEEDQSDSSVVKTIGDKTLTPHMTEWIEITTEEGPDGGATKRVPKEWYEYNQRAERVLQTLREQFSERAGVTGFGLGKGERVIAGKTCFQPVAHAEEEIAEEIPDEIDGIPIRIEPPKGDPALFY